MHCIANACINTGRTRCTNSFIHSLTAIDPSKLAGTVHTQVAKQMASGVFGTPISEKTVIATGEYKEPITQKDVADYAMKMINAGGKDINAQTFVDNLKERFVSFVVSFIVRSIFLLLACL